MPKKIVRVLGWRSKHAYLCTPRARKGVYGYLGWVCFKRTMPKKHCVGSGVALQTRIPEHTTGQKRCLWIPRMGAFETHNAKKYCMSSGVALQTSIPVHTTGKKRCLWIPRMGVFETHHAKKHCVGSGVALQTRIPVHTTGEKRCFEYLGSVCLKRTILKNIVWVLGWRSKHAYLCTPRARKVVFGYLAFILDMSVSGRFRVSKFLNTQYPV